MHILVIADKIPSSRLGDGLRLFGLLRPLAARHRFDLLCFARSGDSIGPEAAALFEKITTLPFPSPPTLGTGRRAIRALRVADFKVNSSDMRKEIDAAISGSRYDLLLEVSANMLLTLPQGPLGVPLVVDSIDEPILRDLRALQHAPPPQWPRLLRQLLMFWRYERATLNRAAANIYASELDAKFYAGMFPGREVRVIPNGVDVNFFSPQTSLKSDRDLIVFEGNMMFPPNIDAARRLCHEILPLVRARRSSAGVCLVGRDPTPEVQALASAAVEVTGTVPDVRPYLAKAAVFACPMRLGSGIKNKILQAWAMGLPVVATSQSLGGLDARDGVNLFVRDSPAAFANAVTELLADPARARELGRAGRQTVVEKFSWQHCAAAFEQILENACNANAKDAPHA